MRDTKIVRNKSCFTSCTRPLLHTFPQCKEAVVWLQPQQVGDHLVMFWLRFVHTMIHLKSSRVSGAIKNESDPLDNSQWRDREYNSSIDQIGDKSVVELVSFSLRHGQSSVTLAICSGRLISVLIDPRRWLAAASAHDTRRLPDRPKTPMLD
jgi:hypothetical protein